MLKHLQSGDLAILEAAHEAVEHLECAGELQTHEQRLDMRICCNTVFAPTLVVMTGCLGCAVEGALQAAVTDGRGFAAQIDLGRVAIRRTDLDRPLPGRPCRAASPVPRRCSRCR